jgi:hypothetical protein
VTVLSAPANAINAETSLIEEGAQGLRYVTVSAKSRHIQESAFLLEAKNLPVRDRARSAAA